MRRFVEWDQWDGDALREEATASPWVRVRFETNLGDPRPVTFPPPGPHHSWGMTESLATANDGHSMTDLERLKALLVARSIELGEFTLASEATSEYYIDARATTMSAEGQALVGKVGLARIRESGLDPTHVGGLTMGADPVAYAIAHRSFLDGQPIDGFSVRKRAKEHGTGRRIEGGLPTTARCVIVEDTMTTGRSTLVAVEALRAHGAQVAGVFTLVNRSGGKAEAFFEGQGIPLLWSYTGDELLEAARTMVAESQEELQEGNTGRDLTTVMDELRRKRSESTGGGPSEETNDG